MQDKRFWNEPRAAPAPAARAGGSPVSIELWLFGALVPPGMPRPLRLELAAPFSVRDVLGPELAVKAGAKSCRIFVDAVALDDLDAPLEPRAARIEIILLTGIEGG